jgi:hypothetical protein
MERNNRVVKLGWRTLRTQAKRREFSIQRISMNGRASVTSSHGKRCTFHRVASVCFQCHSSSSIRRSTWVSVESSVLRVRSHMGFSILSSRVASLNF